VVNGKLDPINIERGIQSEALTAFLISEIGDRLSAQLRLLGKPLWRGD
jgi:hypothetical protein